MCRAFLSVICQPMELIYCNQSKFLSRYQVTRFIHLSFEVYPSWQYTHLLCLSLYQVIKLLKTFPTLLNTSVITTKGKNSNHQTSLIKLVFFMLIKYCGCQIYYLSTRTTSKAIRTTVLITITRTITIIAMLSLIALTPPTYW